MTSREIVGVVLVRNEDRFLGAALEAASGFCDRFLLFDNGSRDGSAEILRSFAGRTPGAEFRAIAHPSESHAALAPFCGRAAWVFGVDGDEVYDPAGLRAMRERILGGEFDRHWMVMGNCLHAEEADGGRATGFLAPPSRSVTKLYNFSAISAWPGRSMERLHGGTPVFREGYSAEDKRLLFEEASWEESPFRCLHLCFCRRSSLDGAAGSGRPNIDEIYNGRFPALLMKLWRKVASGGAGSAWKRERYRRGPRTTVSTDPFPLAFL